GIGTTTPVYTLQVNGTVAGTAAYVITTSHSTTKEQFEDVFVLDKIKQMNLWEWQYKSEFASGDLSRHLYPTTDDFYSAFGLGAGDRVISEADIAGVALKGVKDIVSVIDIAEDKTTGAIVGFGYATSTVLTGDITGLNIDLATNVKKENYNVVGLNVKIAPNELGQTSDPTFAKFISGDNTLYNFSAGQASFKVPVVIENDLKMVGKMVFSPTTTQVLISSTSTIAVNNATNVVISASTSLALNSSPIIADGVSGQFVILQVASTSSAITLQDQDTLAGSNLQLGSTNRTIANGSTLALMFDGTDWVELWYSGNASADFAEMYKIKEDVEAGDVVSFSDKYLETRKASLPDQALAGIISASPAYLIGNEFRNEMVMPVALNGRVQVKISLEAGEIEKGDLLVLSTKPGYAMKYNEEYLRGLNASTTASTTVTMAPIVGVALEDSATSSEKIEKEFLDVEYKKVAIQFKSEIDEAVKNTILAKYKINSNSEVRANYLESLQKEEGVSSINIVSSRVEKVANPDYNPAKDDKIMAMVKSGYMKVGPANGFSKLTVAEKDGKLVFEPEDKNFAEALDMVIEADGSLVVG
ncbi:MAG: hypothetical protein AAB842_00380, partial [Patescibacteria group bacterium]